jgi:hypothetical protein
MTAATAVALLRALTPVDRDVARDAAARELSKSAYHENEPGVLERVINKIVDWLNHLGNALGAGPGGGLVGLLAILVVIGGVIALVLWRTGPLRRSTARRSAVELSSSEDADEHRRMADEFAAQHRYAEAVRERMRAIVRELETRGVIEARPGRTADEIAREAGTLVPPIAGNAHQAARLFGEVWFGGRPAGANTDAAMREADQRIRATRLTVERAVPVAPGGYVRPR